MTFRRMYLFYLMKLLNLHTLWFWGLERMIILSVRTNDKVKTKVEELWSLNSTYVLLVNFSKCFAMLHIFCKRWIYSWDMMIKFFFFVVHLWCVVRFGISHYLVFVWLFDGMRMHANAFFYFYVVSVLLYESAWRSNGSISNISMAVKWLGA